MNSLLDRESDTPCINLQVVHSPCRKGYKYFALTGISWFIVQNESSFKKQTHSSRMMSSAFFLLCDRSCNLWSLPHPKLTLLSMKYWTVLSKKICLVLHHQICTLRSSSCGTSNKLISQSINIFGQIFLATSNLSQSILLFAAADINANSIHYKSLITSQGCRPVRHHDQSTYLCILFCHSWLVFTAK